jgi:hypothetical protein
MGRIKPRARNSRTARFAARRPIPSAEAIASVVNFSPSLVEKLMESWFTMGLPM